VALAQQLSVCAADRRGRRVLCVFMRRSDSLDFRSVRGVWWNEVTVRIGARGVMCGDGGLYDGWFG
jgi:hypothetical protein